MIHHFRLFNIDILMVVTLLWSSLFANLYIFPARFLAGGMIIATLLVFLLDFKIILAKHAPCEDFFISFIHFVTFSVGNAILWFIRSIIHLNRVVTMLSFLLYLDCLCLSELPSVVARLAQAVGKLIQ